MENNNVRIGTPQEAISGDEGCKFPPLVLGLPGCDIRKKFLDVSPMNGSQKWATKNTQFVILFL
jgi:hypothetical protein